MIVDRPTDVKVQSNLDGQKVAMKFDENSLAHIYSILVDMYSDPVLAVIREYSTNALDSHREAGNTAPIEVTLPSPLSPFFKVKDYGVGLSVDEVVNVYSKYGASTKRESNEFNGMLGIGGKSALTYTSQFNVTSVKAGVKIQISVSRDEDGTSTMEIVDTCSTDAPNGVEITVPVKYGADFENKARHFYSFWKAGEVLVNGEQPTLVEGTEVAPGVFSVPGLSGDYIVMGNVAYPVEGGLYEQSYYKDFGVVAYVPIGDINFTPSREALHMTPKSKMTVERVRKEFKDGLVASIQKDIDSSTNHAEAIARHLKWSKMLGYAMPKNMQYKAETIPTQWGLYGMVYEPDRYRRQVYSTRQTGYEWLVRATIITNFTGDAVSQTNKNKIKQYAEENDLRDSQFLLVDKPFGGKWVANIDTVDFDDIKAVKLPSKGTGAGGGPRGKQSFLRFEQTRGYFIPDDTLSTTAKIIYCSPKEDLDNAAAAALTDAMPGVMIVMLGRNRWDKFQRDFPNAQHYSSVIKSLLATAEDYITQDDKIALGLDAAYNARQSLVKYDAKQINDPDLAAAVEMAKAGSGSRSASKGIRHYNNMRTLGRAVGIYIKEVDIVPFVNPLEKYSMLPNAAYGNVHKHAYIYLNAAYAAGI